MPRQMKGGLMIIIGILLLMVFPPLSFAAEAADQMAESVNGKIMRKAEVVDASELDSARSRAQDPFGENWDPLEEMYRIQDKMNRIFQESSRRADFLMKAVDPDSAVPAPVMQARDGQDKYLVSIDMPGVKKEDIKVQIIEGSLIVTGVRHTQAEEVNQLNEYRVSQQSGKIVKKIPLPEDAVEDGIRAVYENGVLNLEIPKIVREEQEPEAKTITVE